MRVFKRCKGLKGLRAGKRPAWTPIWVQDIKCCPAPCTFLAHLRPAQKALHTSSRHRRPGAFVPARKAKDGPRLLHQVDDLNFYYGDAGTAALALKDKTFRRKITCRARLVPARKAKDGPCRLHQVDELNFYYGDAGTAALALKDKTFRRKTYFPKACNVHVQMPGSLNWRIKHARRMFTRCGLGAACWL